MNHAVMGIRALESPRDLQRIIAAPVFDDEDFRVVRLRAQKSEDLLQRAGQAIRFIVRGDNNRKEQEISRRKVEERR